MSENSPLEKKEEKEGTSELPKTSQIKSENPPPPQQILSEFGQKLHIADQQTDNTVSSKESEEPIPEDDVKYETPTSSNHRIPAMTQAPPPPRKTWEQPSTSRRREPKPQSCRSLHFDSSLTPTSSRDTIPAITQDAPPPPPTPSKTREKPSNSRRQAPPPPRKTRDKPSNSSGQAPPPARRRLQYDSSSTEVESNFSPLTGDCNAEKQKGKRIRRDDGTE